MRHFALEDLSDCSLPTENENQEIGRRGLVFAQNVVVNSLKWGFYKTDGDDDHGIDATIEPKKDSKWTGQLIAVQMKTTRTRKEKEKEKKVKKAAFFTFSMTTFKFNVIITHGAVN